MVKVYTTDKIDRLIEYLKVEITKSRLDPVLGKVFLFALWHSRNDNEVILRPKWTFAVPDFNRYLNFYKKFNLLHWNGSQTKFLPDQDLYQSHELIIEIVNIDSVESILAIGKKIPEFQNYYKKAIA